METVSAIWWRRIAAGVLLAGLATRLAAGLGTPLHFDEPFWMLRGDFLLDNLAGGNFQRLRTQLWNIRHYGDDEVVYDRRMGTGIPTAFLTGLGRWVWPAGEPLQEIFASRVLHSILSGLTPVLLLFLARLCGLGLAAGAAFGFFLLADPVLRFHGSPPLQRWVTRRVGDSSPEGWRNWRRRGRRVFSRPSRTPAHRDSPTHH